MDANEPLLAVFGFLAAAVVTMVDGRRAVGWASLAAGLALAPTAASVAGGLGAVVVLVAAAAAMVAARVAARLARRVAVAAGVDTIVPVVGTGESLFGPRSVRAAVSLVIVPAASWVSGNIPLGAASPVTGVLFPAAMVGGCAAMRLLTGRTINDLAVGLAAFGIALATAWFLCAGVDNLASAAGAAALAPAAAIASGWLAGRRASAPVRSVTP